MLDTSLGDGGTFCVLWKPQTRSMQFHASIPPPHLALRGSVDDNCTSRAPTALLALCLLMPPFPSVLLRCLTTFPRSCLWCLRSSSGRIFSRALNFFLRLRRACHWLLLSPAAGLGARFLGSFFGAASFYCTIAADQPGARQRHGA